MQQPLPQIGFGESIKRCIKNFAKFDGRIRRSEYWWFFFLILICNSILLTLAFAFGEKEEKYDVEDGLTQNIKQIQLFLPFMQF